MPLRLKRLSRPLSLAVGSALLGACAFGYPGGSQPPGVTTTPATPAPTATPRPVATPTPSASASASSASASPGAGASASPAASEAPGAPFHDEFDGTTLDPTRWLSYPHEGVVLITDGQLDLLSGGKTATFPAVCTARDVIPLAGPWFFQLSFKMRSAGRPPSFNLDYVGLFSENDPGATTPFMQTALPAPGSADLSVQFKPEGPAVAATFKGALRPMSSHVLRVQFDGGDTFEVLGDEARLVLFHAKRRPTRFWIGNVPHKAISPTEWARLNVDAVEAGPWDPPPSAEPSAALSALAGASPGASPSASPTASPAR